MSARRRTISREKISDIRKRISELQPKEPDSYSVYEAIEKMVSEIDAAFAKNYTFADIIEILKSDGIDISVPTLKQYYAKAKKQEKATAEAPPRRRGRPPKQK